MEDKNKSKDWVDISARLLPGIGAIIAGILIPLVIHINAERNRSNQLYAEIVSKREMADSELRAKMFENLIKYFFDGTHGQKSNKEKLTLLRLLVLNFHESFDLKPLFEEMESELNKEERNELENIANEIVGRQEAMLSQIKEGMFFKDLKVYAGTENGVMVPPIEQEAYRGHRIGIEVVEIGEDPDYAILRVIDRPAKSIKVANIADVTFKLDYYDMPFIDNIKLFNNARFAITLKEIVKDKEDKKAANIKVIFFPETYMSSRDRPYLDEMLEQLKKSKKGARGLY